MTKKKNIYVAMALTILFGPLGLLYSSTGAGIGAIVIYALVFLLDLLLGFSIGLGLIYGFALAPFIVAWSGIIIKRRNHSIETTGKDSIQDDYDLLSNALYIMLTSLVFGLVLYAVINLISPFSSITGMYFLGFSVVVFSFVLTAFFGSPTMGKTNEPEAAE